MATLSIGKAWEETVAFVKREGQLLFPVAFALIALPLVIWMQMIPPELMAFNAAKAGGKPPHIPASVTIGLMLVAVFTLIGALTIYVLALRPGVSVGEALQRAVRRTPALVGAILLVGLAATLASVAVFLTCGMLALVIGAAGATALAQFLLGLLLTYVSARCLLMLYVVVADEQLGVIASIREAWKLGRGQVWRMLAFLMIFFVLLIVANSAAQAVLGLIGRLLGGAELAALLGTLGGAIASAAVQVYLLVMTARIYAQLKGR